MVLQPPPPQPTILMLTSSCAAIFSISLSVAETPPSSEAIVAYGLPLAFSSAIFTNEFGMSASLYDICLT
jgi:hypothetical protein